MYFTPDGTRAIVVAERLARLDFRDPHTFALRKSVPVDCVGIDHMDFSADGRYLIASCEFSGQLVKVDVRREVVVATLALNGGHSKPQDVKLDPTGRMFYVADIVRGGVYTVDGSSFTVTGFVPTGAGAHGLYVSRDSRFLYVTNRNAGTISLIAFATGKVSTTWSIPGGGSPDMGGVSADGKVLWLTGRYDGVVYAIDTDDGRTAATDSGRFGSAWTERVPAARAVLARAHRRVPLVRGRSVRRLAGDHRARGRGVREHHGGVAAHGLDDRGRPHREHHRTDDDRGAVVAAGTAAATGRTVAARRSAGSGGRGCRRTSLRRRRLRHRA